MLRLFALCALTLAVTVPAHAVPAPASAPSAATVTQNFAVPYPPVRAPAAASTVLAREIRQGEYLVKISDCMACHTDHDQNSIKGKPFSGGLPMQTPFGVIYTPNITPDKATGIGSWTFKQFDNAVRYGKSPHGYLFAAMPYNAYNIMSAAQVHSIWEYLQHMPAVHREDRPIDMPPPFKWRWLQFGWQFMFFNPAKDTFKPDPHHSAEWNRGRFIVEGPEHCGVCHTPHNFLGGSAPRFALGGSAISGMWAPDISSVATDPHPVEDITEVFSKARGLGGGTLEGPMLDAISNSMKYMTPADMRAVAVYIRSVTSEVPPGVRPVPESEVDLATGAQIYDSHCAACHASGVGGAPKVGNVADWGALSKAPVLVLYENVWHGVSIMPAKGGCSDCSSRELTSAIAYMLKQSQAGSAPAAATAVAAVKSGAAQNVVGLALGQQVYQAHCAACHAGGVLGAPKYGDAGDWAPRIKLGLPALYQNATHGIGAMPPKGGCSACTAAEIESAVDYMVAASGGKAAVEQALKSSTGKGGS